uniref:Uncharacterized protein n=1 Tax=Rhizophora mucronata TaxID=61149 RepID=A0A2P2QF93_RHIMU
MKRDSFFQSSNHEDVNKRLGN